MPCFQAVKRFAHQPAQNGAVLGFATAGAWMERFQCSLAVSDNHFTQAALVAKPVQVLGKQPAPIHVRSVCTPGLRGFRVAMPFRRNTMHYISGQGRYGSSDASRLREGTCERGRGASEVGVGRQ